MKGHIEEEPEIRGMNDIHQLVISLIIAAIIIMFL